MGIERALDILESYYSHLSNSSKRWMEKSEEYTTQDPKELAKMLGGILYQDSEVIQLVISELKGQPDSQKTHDKKLESLSLELKQVIADEVKKALSEYKKNNSKTPKVVVRDSKRKKLC